jgi:lysophospholipase L1-like esterase
MTPRRLALISLVLFMTRCVWALTPAEFKLVGDWDVEITVNEPGSLKAIVRVEPPVLISVSAERYDTLPPFNPKAAGWIKGTQLHCLQAQECTTPHLLDPNSFNLRVGPEPDAAILERGKDYDVDLVWGTFGRGTNGLIRPDQAVFASYRHGQARIDAVVLTRDGGIVVRQGQGRSAAPLPPEIEDGEHHLGNIWIPGRMTKLGPEHLYPILELSYPEPPKPSPTPADQLLPKTMKKLRTGERLRLLALGDSVTVGSYLPDWQHNRWQAQLAGRLRERFPKADIELLTEAWGGRNTGSYLGEAPGSPHNYQEKVLDSKPDLVVSEFVNDAGLKPTEVEQRYRKLVADFQGIGAEWIILTPHYVRPDWMGLAGEREIDDDPRPYVAGLRQFAAEHPVALADASHRYGRLWRQGIPYSTLLLNSINHPDTRGMSIFADAVMELFP